MADQQAQFEAMLVALTGTDNLLRKQAEEAYNTYVASDAVWTIQALVQVGCNSENSAASNIAFVMLRKLLARKSDAFDRCDADTQAHVKSSLVTFFGSTQQKLLRRACASCISNLAVKLSSDGKNAWPELWDLLVGAMEDANTVPELRASCCLIFAQTATFLASAFLRDHVLRITAALEGCIMSGHGELAKEAGQAIVEVVRAVDLKDLPKIAGTTIVSTIVTAGGQYILKDDTETAEALFGAIAAIAEERSLVVKPHLQATFDAMMAVAQNPALDKELRHTAIDTILTYGEADAKTFRKNKQFANDFFALMVQYTTRPEMESDWATTYESSDEANGSDFEAGASAMDRVCVILQGKQVQEMATQHIMANINHEAWEMRAAALTVLTYVAEGCKKQFIKFLDMIVDQLVLPKVEDPHPMVRYCAMQCIAQMSTDFKPHFQETYAHKVLPAVCGRLADEVPRLIAMAAATIDQFFEELDEDDEDDYDETEWENRMSDYKSMQPFMTPVIQALMPALQNAQYHFQRVSVLACMATCTQVAGKLYTPFVTQLVPLYQTILAFPENCETTEEFNTIRKMKCTAIECTTLLASHVGSAAFAAYSHDVCNYLLGLLAGGLEDDDIRLRYILRGWTCMVECLKTDVLPYLPTVMPQLLQVANIECDAEVTEAEVGDDEEHKDGKVQVVRITGKGGATQTVKLHTGLIEDKDLAITIIMCIVEELKGHMLPYLQPIMDTGIKLLEFLAYPDVRETAATTLAHLSLTVKEAAPENSAAYAQHVVPPLLKALEGEPELSAARDMMEALGDIVTNAPEASITGEPVAKAAEILNEIFEESLERLEVYLTKHQEENAEDEEPDEETAEELAAAARNEDFLLQEVAETVGKLVKTTPEFIPSFDATFLPMVQRLLDPSKPAPYHRLGLCILCDYVEHAPAAAANHLADIAQAMTTFATSASDPEVLQAAFFGSGVTAELIAHTVPQPNADSVAFARNLCEAATRFLLTPSSREDEGLSVSANAVSAILRIIEAFPGAVDIPAAMRTVVNHLPVQDDKDEEIRINDRLVRWAMDPSNPVMSDPNMRSQIIFAVKRGRYMSDDARAALASM